MAREVALTVNGGVALPIGEHTLSFRGPVPPAVVAACGRESGDRAVKEMASDRRSGQRIRPPRSRAGRAAVSRARSNSTSSPGTRLACGKIATTIFEALWESTGAADVRLRLSDGVSPLSKQKPDDPDTVERFELYAGGFEIANGFSELNDPAEQRRRFEAQLRIARPATPKRTRWTRTTSARSSTACRRPAGKASASIAS
jgi:lysyl-tRNA synthetase class 2